MDNDDVNILWVNNCELCSLGSREPLCSIEGSANAFEFGMNLYNKRDMIYKKVLDNPLTTTPRPSFRFGSSVLPSAQHTAACIAYGYNIARTSDLNKIDTTTVVSQEKLKEEIEKLGNKTIELENIDTRHPQYLHYNRNVQYIYRINHIHNQISKKTMSKIPGMKTVLGKGGINSTNLSKVNCHTRFLNNFFRNLKK